MRFRYLEKIVSLLGGSATAGGPRRGGALVALMLAATSGSAHAGTERFPVLHTALPATALERSLLDALALPPPVGAVPVLASHQIPAAAPAKAKKLPSGLAWQSGMQCYTDQFGTWRGRTVDVNSIYLGRTTWGSVFGSLTGDVIVRAKVRPGPLVMAMPMFIPGQKFSDCNAGTLDPYFTEIGKILNTPDLMDSIVRLGWEANGTSYAWSIKSDVEGYKACFRRLVGLLRTEVPGLQIEWSMRRDNGASVGAHLLYPGDDVVSIVGTSAYDRYPSLNTQAQWDAEYKTTKQGGPKGLGTWLTFAKSKKKKFAVSEWAVSHNYKDSKSLDNPFFVDKMYNFFKTNAADLSYEAYYNCDGENPDIYRVHPESWNPKAGAKYRALWKAGK